MHLRTTFQVNRDRQVTSDSFSRSSGELGTNLPVSPPAHFALTAIESVPEVVKPALSFAVIDSEYFPATGLDQFRSSDCPLTENFTPVGTPLI